MAEPLKDMYNRKSVGTLADAIRQEYTSFNREVFLERVFDEGWPSRELKERMRHISLALGGCLPSEYRVALEVLQRVMPNLGELGFEKIVFPDFVEVYGLDDWQTSIPALEFFTQHISAEFAIRPFIARYPERTMNQMLSWAGHEHPGVRRLASEGCRPRLPWAMALPALKADPSPILPILEKLKLDESESVRRSVANNLNDISKDNPDVVIEVLQRWREDDSQEIQALTSHALRTLVKAGHPQALALLGYPPDPAVAVRSLAVEPEAISMGESVTLSFEIESLSDQPQNLMVDYTLYLVRAGGKRTRKVFKLSKRTIQPGEILQITKKHSFQPVTTRRYYPGEHAIQPQINGKVFEQVSFMLLEG